MSQVSAVPMQSDARTVAGALVWAYQQLKGAPPPRAESWLWPLALSAFETAHWRQADPSAASYSARGGLYNYNLGNVTTTGASGDWFLDPAVTNGLRFASYDSLGAGALAMLKTLQHLGGLQAADTGDWAGWQAALNAYLGSTYPDLTATIQSLSGTVPAGYVARAPVPWGAVALASAIVLGSGAVAYYMVYGVPELALPRFARSNPVRRKNRAKLEAKDRDPEPMYVQSLLFPRTKYDVPMAQRWAKKHGYKYGEVDSKPEYIHIRQADPAIFGVIRTIPFGGGIQARVGR